jgi:hypothetical protein
MATDPTAPTNPPVLDQSSNRPSIWRRPTTRLGWLVFSLTIVLCVLAVVYIGIAITIENTQTSTPMINLCPGMLVCALGNGVLALLAFFWRRDRTWLVLLAIVPALLGIILLLGDLLKALLLAE